MGLLPVIGVVLIILKLCGLIAISWWLVTLPFWIIPVIWIVMAIFFGGLVAAFGNYTTTRRKRR